MFDQKGYLQFIAGKGRQSMPVGMSSPDMPDRLFDHQRAATEFALARGRAALFLDTGLGKSGCEAVFADQASRETGKPALILTPLAVARQMQAECRAFGVSAKIVREADEVAPGVNIANYERLGKLDPACFGAVVLDESSILKSFGGATKRALVDAFSRTPFRLAATATPAPNDHMEIGQHAEFLGEMNSMEMLCRWFINDTSTASQSWRLKGHAKEAFWAWVASWGRAASLPSDLGGDDAGFILPPMNVQEHVVSVDLLTGGFDGLFRIPDQSATAIHREKQETLAQRVARAAEIANAHDGHVIVWCERDDESAALTDAINGAIEVKGSMPLEKKEAALNDFTEGRHRVLVSKPRLAGFGLNLQHVHCQVFASISHSYEQYYQSVRRSWRFGQSETVQIHVVMAETETAIWQNILRKSADHDRMKSSMTQAMRSAGQASERIKYARAPKVDLPAFMKGEVA